MIKKILLGLLIAVVLVVVIFVAVVSMQPDTFALERSTTIKAEPERVFPLVNDFQAWKEWGDWTKDDPNAKVTFSEPAAGKGATMSFDGNDKVGAGTMTILESKPDEMVLLEQAFVRPMEGKCEMKFLLTPASGETKLTWRMDGKYNNFLEKAMCTIMSLDAMVGPKFEEGLAGIKRVAEKKQTEAAMKE
jgi:hypothetical protein